MNNTEMKQELSTMIDKKKWFNTKLNKLVSEYAAFSGKSYGEIYNEIKEFAHKRESIAIVEDALNESIKDYTYNFNNEFNDKSFIANICNAAEDTGFRVPNHDSLKYDAKRHKIEGVLNLIPTTNTIDIDINKDDIKDE